MPRLRSTWKLLFFLLGFGGGWADDPLDRLEQVLAWSWAGDSVRARLSGTLDWEEYSFNEPAPAFLYADGEHLSVPRATLFLDAQLGASAYVFAEFRADRGFDPAHGPWRGRLDEYALRLRPVATVPCSLQLGKFATVVGNWVSRHDSWGNPFINAPLPYEQLTGIFDAAAATSAGLLLRWANLGPGPFPPDEYLALLRVPVIWGPSYATGAAVLGTAGRFTYAAEIKNASLSSRPSAWDADQVGWANPTFSGRLGFSPDEAWHFGISASRGSYLLPEAQGTIPAGLRLADYREIVVAADASYAWHHLQVWAELFQARFTIPRVGPADTTSWYVEARYKFTPQFSAAVRWSQQVFGSVPVPGGAPTAWGRDTWRIDVAPAYRFSPHLQLKVQYSYQHHPLGPRAASRLFATQLVLRF